MTTLPVAEAAPNRLLHKVAIIGIAVLALGSASVGTWASFSASTGNDASFSTGTLVLSNQVGVATTCLSSDDSGVNANATDCDALLPVAVRAPGDSATADVTLGNEGNLAGALGAYLEACTDGDAPGTTFHGSGEPCGLVQVTVQEYASAAARTAGNVTGGNCRYGQTTGADVACAFGPTLDGLVAAHGTAANALDLGTFDDGAERYFRVALHLPVSADNTMQGRQVDFGIVWRLSL